MSLAGFEETWFAPADAEGGGSAEGAQGRGRTVHRRGKGPAVIVMHEIPGITPEVAAFATRVADAGLQIKAEIEKLREQVQNVE